MFRDDAIIIKSCLDGDEAAWMELVSRYKRLVYSIPMRNGFSQADAEDVFQNVFTIVYRRLASLRDQKLLAAWLIRITYHECQHLRRRNPDHFELPETLVDEHTPLEEEIEIMEKQYQVREAINQLDSPCRDLLTALFLETPTPSYEELSNRMGIPLGSIGPTRARCFKKLQAILAEMGVELGV